MSSAQRATNSPPRGRPTSTAVPAAKYYIDYSDFTLWVLRVARVRWIGGYGRMDSATGEAYAAADPTRCRPARRARSPISTTTTPRHWCAMAQGLGGYPRRHRGDMHRRRPLRAGPAVSTPTRHGLHPRRLRRTDRLVRRITFGHSRIGRRALGYSAVTTAALRDTWQAAFDLIRTRGHERRDEPFKLASGQLSHDYIDGKYAVDTGERLTIVSRAVADLAADNGIEFDAVGGLTMGADPLAHGVAMVTGKAWFSVRKEQKQRGREQWVEGTRLQPGTRVLLVDDVISTGGSTELAFDRIDAARRRRHRRDPDGRPRRRRRQAVRRAQRAVRRAGHLPRPGIDPIKDV